MAKQTILGIDIGYDRLKIALVSNGRVVSVASEEMPENLFREGRFTSREAMSSLLRELMKENGIKANKAAVILPNELVYVKNIDMPLMTEDQLAYNLPFEFHDYITGEVQEYMFDYAVVSSDEEALHLMAAGVEKTVVEDIQAMVRKAGLKLVKTSPALCTFISLIRANGNTLGEEVDEIGILDLGHHGISMYMYRQDQHVATREFEMGLFSLDDIIADKYGIERHLAHTYVEKNYENCLASEECVNFYDNIAVELMRAINFYEFSNQGSNLSDIWIFGGGAVNEALVAAIDETLGAEIHFAYELLPGEQNDPELNSFVQAIGVTLEI